jgi:hypothetical protein
MTEQLKVFEADNRRERVFNAVKGYEASRKMRKTPCRCLTGARSSILDGANVSGKGFGGYFRAIRAKTMADMLVWADNRKRFFNSFLLCA